MNPPIKNAPPYAQGVRLYLIRVATHNKKCRNVNENADIPTFFLALSSKTQYGTIRRNTVKSGGLGCQNGVRKACRKSGRLPLLHLVHKLQALLQNLVLTLAACVLHHTPQFGGHVLLVVASGIATVTAIIAKC